MKLSEIDDCSICPLKEEPIKPPCASCDSKETIETLEKVDKYRWHDLRENPDDLPKMDCEYQNANFSDVVLIISESWDAPIAAFVDLKTKIWYNLFDSCHFEDALENPIAWKYIEPFEESVLLGDD